jgi:hypothetical protein
VRSCLSHVGPAREVRVNSKMCSPALSTCRHALHFSSSAVAWGCRGVPNQLLCVQPRIVGQLQRAL